MKATFALILCLVTAASVLAGTTREPISILSDEDFTEKNGVVAGSGTTEDPYLISGWQVQVPEGEEYGIRVEGTSRAFVIDECVIKGARDPQGAAIYFQRVEGGAVKNTIVDSSRHGLEIVSSRDITVRETNLSVSGIGLKVAGASVQDFRHQIDRSNLVNGKEIHYHFGLEDEVLELEDSDAGHITIAGSSNVVIRGASVEEGDGLKLAFSEEVTVEEADLFNNRGTGLSVVSSPGTVVRDSERIANNADAGISLWLSDRSVVEGVGLYANHTGLKISASDRVEARGNVYAGNQVGIWVEGGAREVDIIGGLVFGGNNGVKLESSRGPRVEELAFSDLEIAVSVGAQVSHALVRDCTMVDVGYGLFISGSQSTVERNMIARADVAILFPETYGEASPTENTLRWNVLHRSWEGLYLARDTRDNRVYENLFWDCSQDARDVGENRWAPHGQGNWYSGYEGSEVDDTGVGDVPMDLGGGLQDEAPLVNTAFLPGPPGLLGALEPETVVLEDDEGRRAELSALVADTAHARFIRLQGVPAELVEDVALLSRWDIDVESQFRSKHVFLPLDVAFFSSDGTFVGKESMEPDTEALYKAPEPFRIALEMPSGLLEELGLVEPVNLVP
ncbi:MAG: NosD domain-containing protein [Candidatus Bipolaricaulota bacterium]